MTLDNRNFIARHHKIPPVLLNSDGAQRRIRPFVVLLLTVTYVALFLLFGALMDMQSAILVAGVVAFVLSFIAAFAGSRILHIMNTQERERSLMRAMMDNSSIGRLVTDASDRIVYINAMFRSMFDKQPMGLNALPPLFPNNPEAAGLLRAMADQAHRGLTDTIELSSMDAASEKIFRVTVKPVPGWPKHLHWLLEDITRPRIQERELREEREKLIDFTDNAPVGFFSVQEDGRFVFANATLARWLGEDMTRLTTRARFHDYLVDPPADAAPYDILAGGGARQVGEVRMKGANGNIFLASINQTVVQEDDGRVRTRGVVSDLTAERKMKQALEASEDRFQRFFAEAPLGIAIIDKNRIIKDCNRALAHMLGMTASDVEGQNFDTFLDNDYRHEALEILASIEQGKPIPSMELRLFGKKGPAACQLHARLFTDKDGDGIVLHLIDLSRQKALEAQFVQSQKMQAIGQLAGGVAHDFNNLLTAMIGFCDLLLLRHKPSDPSFADINQIKQNANRAANLVRQLLAFSRQQTLRPRVQDITDILIELSHLMRRLIGANIDLTLHHGTDLGFVRVDEGQMEQVLINLAVNARDAMPEGGRLTIATETFRNKNPLQRGTDLMPVGEWVAIKISDTGTGIPPEVMARIFEPFFTTKPVGQGTGLGLSTVYGIMRQTGGYVHVDSKVNEGTTFTLYLPRLAQNDDAAAKTSDAPQTKPQDLTGDARILLVEDEDAVRSFSTRALTNKGYQVVAAASGEEAVDLFQKENGKKIDLLITDVVMPNMDGPTVAKTLRGSNPDLKIIFISGYTEDRLRDYMGPGIFFLPKPFTLKQLAEKVKDVLGS